MACQAPAWRRSIGRFRPAASEQIGPVCVRVPAGRSGRAGRPAAAMARRKFYERPLVSETRQLRIRAIGLTLGTRAVTHSL
jgi:hypothetical protein